MISRKYDLPEWQHPKLTKQMVEAAAKYLWCEQTTQPWDNPNEIDEPYWEENRNQYRERAHCALFFALNAMR